MNRSIWIGYDPRETDAFEVCARSIVQHLSEPIPIFALRLDVLQRRGLYQRPVLRHDGQLWDKISQAPMSTEFAVSRFFVPHLADGYDLALFMDCDMLVRADLVQLFDCANHQKAIQVVKHQQRAEERQKMDGQIQTAYERKNWSSVMLWNLRHGANRMLTLNALNQWSGRALHQFRWLEDMHVGELAPEWNHLVGVEPESEDAKIVHFTLGIPRMPGYENCEYADEWRAILSCAP